MHTHFCLLAILAPSIICAPLSAPPANHLSTRQPIEVISFNPNLKATMTHKRARGREASTSNALAEEKRAYELEVLRADSISLKGRSAQDVAAAAAVVEREVDMNETLLSDHLAVDPTTADHPNARRDTLDLRYQSTPVEKVNNVRAPGW